MLIANLHCMSIDVYINVNVVMIVNNADLLELLMIYNA